MSRDYWLQQKDKPLFEDLIWSRPENKRHAGKLLIVGGNVHGFSAPAESYQEAVKAGIGTCRVLLPDALEKMVSKLFPPAEYAPSTPSGSFATKALAELLDRTAWADGVLLADNFGKNSETAILFEKFNDKYKGPLSLIGDSIDYFLDHPLQILDREETLITLGFAQLQKLGTASRFTTAFTSEMGLLKIVDSLHEFTNLHKATIIVSYENNVLTARNGKVVTTQAEPIDEIKLSAHTTVWWLQHLKKPLESSASAIHQLNK